VICRRCLRFDWEFGDGKWSVSESEVISETKEGAERRSQVSMEAPRECANQLAVTNAS